MADHLSSTVYVAPILQRYIVTIKTQTQDYIWEGYADTHIDATIRSALWMERNHPTVKYTGVVCEIIK